MKHASQRTLAALGAGRDVPEGDYAHVDRCVRCRTALGVPLPGRSVRHSRVRNAAAIAAVAAVFVAIAAISPVRAAAYGFIEIFEPRQIAFVPIDASDFGANALPDFGDFGTGSQLLASQNTHLSDLRSAQAVARFHLRVPPEGGLREVASVDVTTPAIEQFVFDERKARAAAAESGRAWQPMPPGMDGSVVRVVFGPTVTARFDDDARATNRAAYSFVTGSRRTHVSTSRSAYDRSHDVSGTLFLAQMPVPKVGSTGVSMREIETYVVSRPGVSPKLAAAFAALRDPSTTLPLPIPMDRKFARPAAVDGVWGTMIGDDTGLGAFVVWERNGFVYALGGAKPANEIIAIANSLR